MGLIYWWLVFKNDVEVSVVQMSISLMMFIASLLLVLAANALHLGAISVDVLGAGTIAKVVIIAILLNLSASLLYPLASPEHIAALMKQIAIGLVWAKAQGNVMANLDQLAAQTQTELEARMWQTIRGQINQTAASRLFGDGDGDDEGHAGTCHRRRNLHAPPDELRVKPRMIDCRFCTIGPRWALTSVAEVA